VDIYFLVSHLSEWLGVIAVLMIVERVGKRKPAPVKFQYPQREKWYSLAIYGLALIFSIFFFIKGINFNLNLSVEIDPALITRLVVALLCLAIVVLALLYRKQPFLSAGWGRKNYPVALRLGLALVFLTILLRGKALSLLGGVTLGEGLGLFLWLGISFAEDTVFRGYLQLRFDAWLGVRYGWLLTSLFYFIWQIPFYLPLINGSWEKLLIVAVQSLVLSWIMRKSGHILSPFLYHAISEWAGLLK
jgi:membrane protease YdiL (CAAX protease family)